MTENSQNPSQPLSDESSAPAPVAPGAGVGSAELQAAKSDAAELHTSDPAAGRPVSPESGEAPADVVVEPTPEYATPEYAAAEAALPEPVEEPPRGPIEETPESDEPPKLNWYILKVQSNREDSIRESLKRRVAVAGLEKYFDEIIVPIEMVSEFKGGKKRVVKRKLYPGYLVVHMEINEDTWFLVRETPGIGDFTGSAGKPTPMLPHEVSKIVSKQEEKTDEAPKLKINFNVSDRVKINEGTFDNFEGEVDSIDEASGRVTVMINIFGRSTPVELEYWQIEAI